MLCLWIAVIIQYTLIFKHGLCQGPPGELQSASSTSSASSTASPQSCVSKIKDPVIVPLKDVALANGTTRWGLQLAYGTPPQTFAMALSNDDNNTYLIDTVAACSTNDSSLGCTIRDGGRFDRTKSSTFLPFTNLSAPDLTLVQASDRESNDTSGTDILRLNSAVSISNFSTGIFRGSDYVSGPQENKLALSPNATMWTALLNAGIIDSRNFGYYGGTNRLSNALQVDGSLIFGGYDQAKLTGQNHTFQMNYGSCPSGLKVTVSDITMNFQNGTNVSIIGSELGSAYGACINLGDFDMSIPQNIWAKFLAVSQSIQTGRTMNPFNYWTMLVDATSAYTGDLTVRLDPDFIIRIPNDQLVIPNYDMNHDGQTYLKTTTDKNVLLASLEDVNKNDMPLLARLFLSMVYIFVDYDQNHFVLWQGQPTNDSNLVAVGPSICSTSTSVPTTTSSPIPSSGTQLSGPHTGLSKGDLAGSIIGITFATSLCLTVWYLWRRKNKRSHQAAKAISEPIKDTGVHSDPDRVAATGYAPQEVPVEKEPPDCLAPYELANRVMLHELATRERVNELATSETAQEMP